MSDKSTTTDASDDDATTTRAREIEAQLRTQLDELETIVREHPLATIGIAAAAGALATLLLSRR